MAAARTSVLLRHLREALLLPDGAGLTDGQLLECFLLERNEAAFEVLVHRHGPMVMGVCRRLIGNLHDAEDAFQASFLVLARKAASISPREAVGNWLYGVACRTARRVNAVSVRRRSREKQVMDMPHPTTEPADLRHELEPFLDQELGRLPDKYRLPLVLCELEGRSRKEVARQLKLAEGTLSSRLATARKLLAGRLARHGLAIPGGALAALLSQNAASASVPSALVTSTGKAATLFAAGEAAARVAVSAKVIALTEGVLKTMLLMKLKFVMVPLVLAGLSSAAALVYQTQAAEQPKAHRTTEKADKEKQPANKNQKPKPGTLLLSRQGGLVALTPEGKEEAELALPKDTHGGLEGRFSPDGTQVAFIVGANSALRPPLREGEVPEPWPFKVVVRKLGAAEPMAIVDLPAHHLTLAWAADGKRVLVTKDTSPDASFETILLDPKTGATEPLELPAEVRVLDWSRDGKTFLVVHRQDKKYRLGLMARGGNEARDLIDLKVWRGYTVARLSPNGTKVLYVDADPTNKDAHRWGWSNKVYLLDVATRKREPLAGFPSNGHAEGGVAWAPDGKRIAYTWKRLHTELLKKDTLDVNVETEAFLMIADSDGQNAKTVSSGRCDNSLNRIFGSIDWR